MAKPGSIRALVQAQQQPSLRNLRGTVGVAPGTYTLQLGAPVMPLVPPPPNSWQLNLPTAPCPPDGWGTGAYGVPRVGWYDVPNQLVVTNQSPSQAASDLLNPYGTESQLKGVDDGPSLMATVYSLLSIASGAVSAYHGYKRHHGSIGWAIGWGLLGGIFPVITPAIAFAQGIGKPMAR
jgi:hypothetical protein